MTSGAEKGYIVDLINLDSQLDLFPPGMLVGQGSQLQGQIAAVRKPRGKLFSKNNDTKHLTDKISREGTKRPL